MSTVDKITAMKERMKAKKAQASAKKEELKK